MGWFWCLPRVPLDMVALLALPANSCDARSNNFLGETKVGDGWFIYWILSAMIIEGQALSVSGVFVLIITAILFSQIGLLSVAITKDSPEVTVVWMSLDNNIYPTSSIFILATSHTCTKSVVNSYCSSYYHFSLYNDVGSKIGRYWSS